jgi:protein-tyrosine phosphatase
MTRFEVEADGPGCLIIRWEPAGDPENLLVGAGPTPEPDLHTHLMEVSSALGSARVKHRASGRPYVSISGSGGVQVVAERRVPLLGIGNFRDLGGYRTKLGGHTRWGLVFRSDSLHPCTPEDLDVLDALGLRTIYDLRRNDELAEAPGPRASVQLTVPSGPAERDPTTLRGREQAECWLFEYYCGILAVGGSALGRLLTELAQTDAPVVFHCMGGKDRTGMAAALLLSWLGVDRETVLDDYELPSVYSRPNSVRAVIAKFAETGIDTEAAEGMLSTPRWAMADALGVLDEQYGGIEVYLRGPGEMKDEALKALRSRLVV